MLPADKFSADPYVRDLARGKVDSIYAIIVNGQYSVNASNR